MLSRTNLNKSYISTQHQLSRDTETDVSVQEVSADGWYAVLSLQVPPMFLYLVNRFAQEVGANNPDAPIVMAGLCAVENLILHQHPDRENIHTNVQQKRLPFTCIQSLTS